MGMVPLAVVAGTLLLALVLAGVLTLAWIWGGPQPLHGLAISLATTRVGA